MSRIRTIKPEFPQSESMGRVSRDARLTFVLLWTVADDAGRLRGNPALLAGLLFPYDEDARKKLDGWLAELEREDCITRYRVGADSYIAIANWREHQKIDRPSPSRLPDPPGTPRENPREDSSNAREASSQDLDQDQDQEGTKDQGGDRGARAERSRDATRLPADWQPSVALKAWAGENEPAVDAYRETLKFLDYWRAASGAKARKHDWDAAWRGWISRAAEDGKGPKHGAGHHGSRFKNGFAAMLHESGAFGPQGPASLDGTAEPADGSGADPRRAALPAPAR